VHLEACTCNMTNMRVGRSGCTRERHATGLQSAGTALRYEVPCTHCNSLSAQGSYDSTQSARLVRFKYLQDWTAGQHDEFATDCCLTAAFCCLPNYRPFLHLNGGRLRWRSSASVENAQRSLSTEAAFYTSCTVSQRDSGRSFC